MVINMEEKVLQTIDKKNLINSGDNIVLGLSGGPDSMALLYALIHVKKQIDFNLILAHVNHGVRGEEALRDEEFVKAQAKELNLECYTKKVDMVSYGKKMGITSEEAGRQLRYGFFREILMEKGGGKIAVAHNKDDQAETLIMRIFRGTGIDGLKGMEFLSNDIIRPILNITRKEIEDYIDSNGIDTVLDHTNLLPIYTRNKIRLELIPYIEENFNPNLVESLWRMSQISKIDSEFLEEASQEKYNYVLNKEEKNCIILNASLFKEQAESMQQRIIRNGIFNLLNDLQGFSEDHITAVKKLFLSEQTGKSLNLPRKIIARVDYNNLILENRKEKKSVDYLYPICLGLNEIRDLPLNLEMELFDIEKLNKYYNDEFTLYVDYDRVQGSLFIRNRRPGDKFIPYGMDGSKKIKDYFIDEKISKDKRDKIPLIVDGENILWILGYRSNNLYKVTEKTKRVLKIKRTHKT